MRGRLEEMVHAMGHVGRSGRWGPSEGWGLGLGLGLGPSEGWGWLWRLQLDMIEAMSHVQSSTHGVNPDTNGSIVPVTS